MPRITKLLDEAIHLGVDRIIMPIDIFELAHRFSVHIDRCRAVPRLIELLEDPDNHFTRFVAMRALRLILGADAPDALLRKAQDALRSEPVAPIRAEAARFIIDAGRDTPDIREALRVAATSDDIEYVRDECLRAIAEIAKRASKSH